MNLIPKFTTETLKVECFSSDEPDTFEMNIESKFFRWLWIDFCYSIKFVEVED